MFLENTEAGRLFSKIPQVILGSVEGMTELVASSFWLCCEGCYFSFLPVAGSFLIELLVCTHTKDGISESPHSI